MCFSVHPTGKISIPFDIESYSGSTEHWQSLTQFWIGDEARSGNDCLELAEHDLPGSLVLSLQQTMNVSHVQILAPKDHNGLQICDPVTLFD